MGECDFAPGHLRRSLKRDVAIDSSRPAKIGMQRPEVKTPLANSPLLDLERSSGQRLRSAALREQCALADPVLQFQQRRVSLHALPFGGLGP